MVRTPPPLKVEGQERYVSNILREPEDDPDLEHFNESRRYISDKIEKKI